MKQPKQQQQQRRLVRVPINPSANHSMDSNFSLIKKSVKLVYYEYSMMGICFCLAILCSGFLYELCLKDLLNPASMREQQNNTIFDKEIGNFRDKIVQMLAKGNDQRALKKLHNEINDKFQNKLDGIEKEIQQMLNDANVQMALMKLQNKAIEEFLAKFDQEQYLNLTNGPTANVSVEDGKKQSGNKNWGYSIALAVYLSVYGLGLFYCSICAIYMFIKLIQGKQNESEKSTRINVVERYIFCGSDDDEKELTSPKLEWLTLLGFILMAIFFGCVLYANIIAWPENSTKPEPIDKAMDEFRTKIVKMFEKGNGQKLQNEIDDKFQAKIEQQAWEIDRIMDDVNGHKTLMNSQNETIHEHPAKNEKPTKEIGQIVEESNAQKVSDEQLHLQTIAEFRDKIDQLVKAAKSRKTQS